MASLARAPSERAGRASRARFERPSALAFLAYVLLLAFVLWSFQGAGWSFTALAKGVPALGDFLSRAWPPSTERLPVLAGAMLQTFQMALVGTIVGVILSVPLAIFAAKGLTEGLLARRIRISIVMLPSLSPCSTASSCCV